MAGRGTDILLGGNPEFLAKQYLKEREIKPDEGNEREWNEALARAKRVTDAEHQEVGGVGGLHILGTERHESRRIDNQLRGRSGGQGDPGSSRFYLSLEDDLMRRFAADRVSKVMEMVGMEEDMPLESNMVSRFIEQAQTKVEGYNFDIRKNVVDYDDVIAQQRQVIYAARRAILERVDMHGRVLGMMRAEVRGIVDMHIPGNLVTEEEQLERLFAVLETWVQIPDEALPDN